MGRVLVVEDDESLRQVVADVLLAEGFSASQANDGRSALSLLRSEELRPDVILLDLMMPVMNGWQFREAQLADPSLASIPVVVMSALETTDIQADARLTKPVELEALVSTVSHLLQSERPRN